jgi:hypothetical protein
MNQSFKDFFDSVEYILLRLLFLGLLGLGAWALLGHAFNLNAALEQKQEVISLPSSSSETRSPTRQRKRQKKRARRPRTTQPHPTNHWTRAAGACFVT